jgi:type IV fimbrial biogenesis protein FimT
MHRRNRHRGVTLVELLFSLGLLALLAGLAAPDLRASLRAAAVRTATFELALGLQQIRADSILESRPASLCPADSSGNCLAAGSDAAGWRAFLGDGAARRELGGRSLPPGVRLRATRSPVWFWPSSFAASAGTLTICDAQGVAAPRALVISATGRARQQAGTARDCVP